MIKKIKSFMASCKHLGLNVTPRPNFEVVQNVIIGSQSVKRARKRAIGHIDCPQRLYQILKLEKANK